MLNYTFTFAFMSLTYTRVVNFGLFPKQVHFDLYVNRLIGEYIQYLHNFIIVTTRLSPIIINPNMLQDTYTPLRRMFVSWIGGVSDLAISCRYRRLMRHITSRRR